MTQQGARPKMATWKRVCLYILGFFGLFGLFGSWYVILKSSKREPPRPDLELRALVEAANPSGNLSILVVRYKNRIFTETWPNELGNQHVYAMKRLSEMFLSTSIMMLEDEGKLSTSDTLGKWFADYSDDIKRIPLSRLLDHTSGLTGSVEAPVLQTAMGETSENHEINYLLLDQILAEVTGSTSRAFFEKQIVEKLALAHTKYDESRGWTTTIEDLLEFEYSLNTNALVKMKTNLKIFTADKLNNGDRGTFGKGWVIEPIRGLRLEEFSASGDGYHHSVARVSQKNFAIIIMSDMDSSEFDTSKMIREIAQIYLSREMRRILETE